MQGDLTKDNILKTLIRFSVPYLLACFLQTFYGLADLFLAGRYCGKVAITAISVGSQIMHMVTVVIVGLGMGTTVMVARRLGAGAGAGVKKAIGNSFLLFLLLAAVLTALLAGNTTGICTIMSVPEEAMSEAVVYLFLCFLGVPFIFGYNGICSVFKGFGDTKSPLVIVAVSGVINIVLDIVFMGHLGFGAGGAAIATITAQGVSFLSALLVFLRKDRGVKLSPADFRPDKDVLKGILGTGCPIAVQDGVIQISFLVVTGIVNGLGVDIAASVGIVEKIICFLFLVPSSMLASISAIGAQNAGAGLHRRAKKVLFLGTGLCIGYGVLAALVCNMIPETILSLFVKEEPEVIRLGTQYLRTYVFDCVFAGIHFCFSGYFCAYERAKLSFLHNLISALAVRIPLAWLAASLQPEGLTLMGLAAPMGSLVSALICVILYRAAFRNPEKT